MAEFSFLNKPREAPRLSKEDEDTFIEVLRKEGVVSQAGLCDEQTIKPGGETENETIDGFDVQYGVVFSDFVFNVSPSRGALHVSQKMANHRKQVIMAIIKTLNPVIPFSVHVDIIEPAADWDIQLWTVKVRNIFDTLELDIENLKKTRYDLVANLRQAAVGKLQP